MNFYIYMMIFLFSLISFIYIRNHILLCLLSLELIVLSILLAIMIFCMMYDFSMYIYVYFMCFFVCEGVLGLAVLVSMIRSHGNDYLNSIFLW
uniref:NADH-ubiquinone oxidoreductase chain 4L n=1 Tax=Cicadella viridis TaxID=36150 RepID=A0A6B9PGU0_CICVR|nr:NADH dehydrogenase subunit 4L [Cicadella viridis]